MRIVLSAILLTFLFTFPTATAHAQDEELNRISTLIARKIEKDKAATVLLLGFSEGDNKATELGRHLRERFSNQLAVVSPRLRIIPSEQVRETLKTEGFPETTIEYAWLPTAVARLVGADIAVVGRMEQKSARIDIRVQAFRARDRKELASVKGKLTRSPQLDELSRRLTEREEGAAIAGRAGVGYPECIRCPNPTYTEEGKQAKIQGAILMVALVNATGKVERVKVIETMGYGLGDRAVKAVLEWRFRPALGPDGKPVATWVPVEVNFRFF